MTSPIVLWLCAGILTPQPRATLACEGWIADRGVPVVRFWTPPRPHRAHNTLKVTHER